jgi:Flp pilus assembly protein TadG
MTHRPRSHRRGAVALEAAIVYPILFFLILALIIGGVGVSRYQQVALLAEEAARWTCVRGSGWQKDSNSSAVTVSQIRQDVVLPMTVGLDPSKLTVAVDWINGITGDVVSWDSSNRSPTTRNSNQDEVANRVRVTITYLWSPPFLLGGTYKLQSVCEIPMVW